MPCSTIIRRWVTAPTWHLSPLALVLLIAILALATRLLPLSISSYPFNNDGITECRIAADIVESGHLEYPDSASYLEGQSTLTPAFNLLLAFVTCLIGSSTFEVAQVTIALIAVCTILCVYRIATKVCGNGIDAFSAVLILGLFGTFVFLTGSTWKLSLGVSLLVLLVYAFMHRYDSRMLLLEILVLILLPIVHHLVAFIAVIILVNLAGWSLLFGIANRTFRQRHIVDVVVVTAAILVAYGYYLSGSLDRMAEIGSSGGFLVLVLSTVLVFCLMAFVLFQKRHAKGTFAFIPAAAFLFVYIWDYFNPIFPYEPGSPSVILLLGGISSVLIMVGWYGLEKEIESNSRFRAVPLAVIVPVIVLLLFTLIQGLDISTHRVIYRTADFADVALALGAGSAFASLRTRPRIRRVAGLALILSLVVSFPFAYATASLVGVRHDTQAYEVDAVYWASSAMGSSLQLHTDERIAYIALALVDCGKDPYLPTALAEQDVPRHRGLLVILDEWMTKGVNDFPRGYVTLDGDYVNQVLSSSNIRYIGGPSENNIIMFELTSVSAVS